MLCDRKQLNNNYIHQDSKGHTNNFLNLAGKSCARCGMWRSPIISTNCKEKRLIKVPHHSQERRTTYHHDCSEKGWNHREPWSFHSTIHNTTSFSGDVSCPTFGDFTKIQKAHFSRIRKSIPKIALRCYYAGSNKQQDKTIIGNLSVGWPLRRLCHGRSGRRNVQM